MHNKNTMYLQSFLATRHLQGFFSDEAFTRHLSERREREPSLPLFLLELSVAIELKICQWTSSRSSEHF